VTDRRVEARGESLKFGIDKDGMSQCGSREDEYEYMRMRMYHSKRQKAVVAQMIQESSIKEKEPP
jgi:hypothetical protein